MAKFLVETDNRTLWVHKDGATVARFCPRSAEVLGNYESLDTVAENDGSDMVWVRFVDLCKKRFGISIPNTARPKSRTINRDAMRTIMEKELAQ